MTWSRATSFMLAAAMVVLAGCAGGHDLPDYTVAGSDLPDGYAYLATNTTIWSAFNKQANLTGNPGSASVDSSMFKGDTSAPRPTAAYGGIALKGTDKAPKAVLVSIAASYADQAAREAALAKLSDCSKLSGASGTASLGAAVLASGAIVSIVFAYDMGSTHTAGQDVKAVSDGIAARTGATLLCHIGF